MEIERDRLLEKLDYYKIENKQFQKLILKKDVVMTYIPTCLLNMKKKVATIETEKRLWAKIQRRTTCIRKWKGANGTRTVDDFIENYLSNMFGIFPQS